MKNYIKISEPADVAMKIAHFEYQAYKLANKVCIAVDRLDELRIELGDMIEGDDYLSVSAATLANSLIDAAKQVRSMAKEAA